MDFPPQGRVGSSIQTSELDDDSVTDAKIAAHTTTKITADLSLVTGVLVSANLDADTAHLAVSQTFTANKNFNGANLIIEDSDILFFGDASDSSIRYDGTNLIIDPQDVGTGFTLMRSDTEIDGGLKHSTLGKQFEEFFEGNTVASNVPLGSPWLFTNNAGTNAGSMLDGINEGYRITTGASTSDRAVITMNDVRHYDAALCTIYGSFKYSNANNVTQMGICDAVDTELAATELITCVLASASTFVAIRSSDGAVSDSASDVSLSTSLVTFKIINDATNMRLFILESGAWVLKVTKTTNKPASQAMQPVFGVRTTLNAETGDAIYLKVQND